MMRKLCPETCNFCGKLHVCKPLTFRESTVLGFPLHFSLETSKDRENLTNYESDDDYKTNSHDNPKKKFFFPS